MTLGVLRHADGFANRVAGHDQVQDLLGDLQPRRGLFERLLSGQSGLLLRARSRTSLTGDDDAEQHNEDNH